VVLTETVKFTNCSMAKEQTHNGERGGRSATGRSVDTRQEIEAQGGEEASATAFGSCKISRENVSERGGLKKGGLDASAEILLGVGGT